MELRDQLSVTINRPGEWHAAILANEDGRQVPVFVRTGNLERGQLVYYVQKVKKVTFIGKCRYHLEQYRLRDGKWKADGWITIAEQQKEEWASRHQAGMKNKSTTLMNRVVPD